MGLKQDKSNRNNPGGSNLSEDEKVEQAGRKIEEAFNPITNTETLKGTEGNDSLTDGGSGTEAETDPAAGNEEDTGPSVEHIPDAGDVSDQANGIIDAKRTEAGASVALPDPSTDPVLEAIDQSDSSEVKQGTTESYTTGQSDRHNDHVQTIDPVTGQGMTRGELRELEEERRRPLQ